MSVQYLFAGGLQIDGSTWGVASILGYDSVSGLFLDTTTNAPRSGLHGLVMLLQNAGNPDLRFPGVPATSAFPADASRTQVSVYLEHAWSDLSTVTSEYQQLCRINFATAGTKRRDLRFYTSGSGSITTVAAGASDPNTTNTTLVDTRKNFVTVGVTVGMWVECNNYRAQVTSITTTTNPNDTLNFTAGWTNSTTSGTGNPGNLKPYTVWTDWGVTYQVYDDGGLPLITSAFISISQVNTLHTIELSYAPVSGGPSTTKLAVDGTVQTSTSGTNIDPATNVFFVELMGSAGKTSNWRGSSYVYNMVVWDNLGSGVWSGAFASQYQATAADRYYVTFLPAKSGTGTQFDAWTKSTGSDPGTLVADVSSRPNTDGTTYLDGGGNNTKQSWKHEAHGSALYPIGDNDTVYAVQAYGGASRQVFTTGNYLDVSIGDGTNETSARSVYAQGGVSTSLPKPDGLLKLIELAPDGAALSPSKLDNLETIVKQTAADATAPRVFSAGMLVLGKPGAVTSVTPNPVALMGNGVGIV